MDTQIDDTAFYDEGNPNKYPKENKLAWQTCVDDRNEKEIQLQENLLSEKNTLDEVIKIIKELWNSNNPFLDRATLGAVIDKIKNLRGDDNLNIREVK